MSKESIPRPPWCPFCGQKVGRPSDAPARKMTEFPVGRCQCGAVYSCDITGHNVGAAMVETLVYACDNNPDFAWELLPEDDYLTGRVEDYDDVSHQVIPTRNLDGRAVRGVLYFVRLHTDIKDIAERIAQKKDDIREHNVPDWKSKNSVLVEPAPDAHRVRQKANKKLVQGLVQQTDIDGLVALCFDDRKTLRLMQRLLYDPVPEHRWHIAWVMGRVVARTSTREPGPVSELLHRLFEACSDSAATPWGMIETIGFVISLRPDIFGAFTRYLFNYLGDVSTRNTALWALGEIAVSRPDLVRDLPFYRLFPLLQHENGETRGHVARLMGLIKASEATMQLMALGSDNEEFSYCVEGELVRSTVAEQAGKALEAIRSEGFTNEQ